MSAPVVVIGGANMDVLARSTRSAVAATSNPGSTLLTPGGVGRNIAENLARLGTGVALVAAVGDDELGRQLLETTAAGGVDVSGVRRVPGATGTYTAVLDHDGELVIGIADMAATDALTPDDLHAGLVEGARIVVLDGNLAPATLARGAELGRAAGAAVVIEPVSVPKARRLADIVRGAWLVTPNRDELDALGGLAALREAGVGTVWVRHGRDGSVLHEGAGDTVVPLVPGPVVDVTGAGDAMLAAYCHAYLAGATPAEAAAYGQVAAALTVADAHTVRPDLTDELVRSHL